MKNYDFLILGSNGLLGSNLVNQLKKNKLTFFTIAKSKSNHNVDLRNFEKLEDFFFNHKFKIVINCVAKVNIDYCEKNLNMQS